MVSGNFTEHHHAGGHEFEQLHDTRTEHRDQLLGESDQHRGEREFQHRRGLDQPARRDRQPSGFGRHQQRPNHRVECHRDRHRTFHLSMVPGNFAEHHHAGGDEFEQLHDTGVDLEHKLLGQGHQCGKPFGRHFQHRRGLDEPARRDQQPSGFGGHQQRPNHRVECDRHRHRTFHLPMVSGNFTQHHYNGGHEFEQLHDTRTEHRDKLLGQGHQCRE